MNTFVDMSLRDDINSAPHGTQAKIIADTGLAKYVVIDALKARFCTAKTAQAIAKAFGKPNRWPDLVVVKSRKGQAGHRDATAVPVVELEPAV